MNDFLVFQVCFDTLLSLQIKQVIIGLHANRSERD